MNRQQIVDAVSTIFPPECIQTRNSLKDSGTGRSFSISVGPDELAIFIKIDGCINDSNSTNRNCDGICILFREGTSQLLIMLLELKSKNNINDAIKQLVSTRELLKRRTQCSIGTHSKAVSNLSSILSQSSLSHGARILALVSTQGGGPRDSRRRPRGIPKFSETKRRLWKKHNLVLKISEEASGLSVDKLFSYAYPNRL